MITEKRRRQGKRTWYPREDHLPWVCACHDCRGRRKRGDITCLDRQRRRELDRDREDLLEAEEGDGGLLVVTTISVPGGELRLRKPIEAEPDYSPHLVTYEWEPLGIIAWGRNREEAEQAFRDELSFLWQEYALAPDEALEEGAQELKRELLGSVEGGRLAAG